MNSHPFDVLSLPSGRLIFTPCPGTKEASLAESIATLKNAGANAVITLMSSSELADSQVAELGKVCDSSGLLWFQMPIADNQAPDQTFIDQLHQHKSLFLQLLNEDRAIAIHCKGGSGRTGLVAAILMLLSGIKLEQVIEQVKNIRPKSLSKPPHIDFLNEFSASLSI